MSKPVPIGTRGVVEQRVEYKNTLAAWKADLPPVLSTPTMIAWMEYAGYEAMAPFCEDGEVSVSTAINVVHRAPTGVGARVKCEAVMESLNGRFLTFRVSAHSGSEVIGYGTIGRAFVNVGKFNEKFRAGETEEKKNPTQTEA